MAEPGNSQPDPVQEKQKIPVTDPDEREHEHAGQRYFPARLCCRCTG